MINISKLFLHAVVIALLTCIGKTSCSQCTGPMTASGPTSFCSGSVTLNVPNMGGAAYRWYNGVWPIEGANSSSYTATGSGTYSCIIYTLTCGPVNASNEITINGPPSIVAQGAVTFCSGGNVVMEVNGGSAATNYQWKLNGNSIAGATQLTYTASASGSYTCEVTNPQCGTKTSNALTITSGGTPQVSLIYPYGWNQHLDNCTNINKLFTVPCCAGTYTIKEFYTGTPLYSQSDNEFQIPGTGFYYVELDNGCGTSQSNVAEILDINSNHRILAEGPTTYCSNSQPSYLYVAPIQPFWNTPEWSTPNWNSYTWKRNGVAIPGANAPTFGATQTGWYNCTVANSCGTAQFVDSLYITVNPLPSATITPAGPTTFCSGGSVVLNAPVTANRTYQWKKGANLLSGATLSSYTATTGGNYTVIATNTVTGCSKTTVSATAVAVNALPAATITPQGPTTFCAGGNVVLQANTGAGLSYKWKKATNYISGATLSNYTATTGGNYKVQVTNSNGCSKTSGNVVVSVPCKEGETISSVGDFDFNIYPNPNSGEFTINFSTKPTSLVKIEITNEIGKVVKKFETDDETVVIKETNLAKGIYCLTIRNKDEVVIKKINIVK
ncbi:MAG: T9SS type A sorting domain-containing protein [Bacteroidota bacterium]